MFIHIHFNIYSYIDAKTASKLMFLYGDDSEGSDNDTLMKQVVGIYIYLYRCIYVYVCVFISSYIYK
jgi:hypothetical protein